GSQGIVYNRLQGIFGAQAAVDFAQQFVVICLQLAFANGAYVLVHGLLGIHGVAFLQVGICQQAGKFALVGFVSLRQYAFGLINSCLVVFLVESDGSQVVFILHVVCRVSHFHILLEVLGGIVPGELVLFGCDVELEQLKVGGTV